jgi:hypothetical protein
VKQQQYPTPPGTIILSPLNGVRFLALTCHLIAGTTSQSVVFSWSATKTVGAIGYNLYWSNGGGLGSYPGTGPVQISATGIFAPISTFYKYLKIGDQGSCTMTAGRCSTQFLSRTYSAAPNCITAWNGTGTLKGPVKILAATTVTPASNVATDTAVVNWVCFGN